MQYIMETIVEVMRNMSYVHNCADTTASHNSESKSIEYNVVGNGSV